MKMRRSTIVLGVIFLLLFCSLILSYCVFPRSTEGKALTSRIIAIDTVSSAETITIHDEEKNNSVELRKEKGLWFARAADKSSVPANAQKIELLLSVLSRQRVMYTTHAAAIREPQFTITIVAVDGTILSDISFFGTDAAGSRVSFSTARDITVLQTENDLSFCEDASTAGWIQHEAFRDIEKTADAQRLVYRNDGHTLTLGRGSEDFMNFMQVLSSTECLDSEQSASTAEDETVRIEFGDASERVFSFSARSGDYRVSEGNRAWLISAWSYARLKSALGIEVR
jgi:hypothetical protein